jgi:hypothetical protein
MLGARKQLLVARASLQRLQAAREVEAIGESLRWPRPLAAVATSQSALSLAATALFFVLGRGRFARVARWTSVALALVRIARAFSKPAPK